VGGPDEEGGGAHCRHRHPEEGPTTHLNGNAFMWKQFFWVAWRTRWDLKPMSLLTLLSFQVTRVFCYLTIVTLQYMVPVLLILFSTLALKALGKTCTVPNMATTSFEGGKNDSSLFLIF
jgi:hypothetical protein